MSEELVKRARSRVPAVALGAFTVGVLFAGILFPALDEGEGDATRTAAVATGASSAGEEVGGTTTETAVVSGAIGSGEQAPTVQGSAAGGGSAAAPSPGGSSAPAGAASTARPAAGPTAAAATSNGGATFRGVTGNSIKIGFGLLDSSSLGAACPRCSNGAGADNAAGKGLVAAWKRDGLSNIHGREIQVVHRKFQLLSEEEARSACLSLAREEKPFAVVALAGAAMTDCLAKEFKIPTISGTTGATEEALAANAPYLHQVGPAPDRTLRNFAHWMDRQNMLKDQKIGLYSGSDGVLQRLIDRSFRAEIKKLGYELAADVTFSGSQSAPVAVQRFRSAGVTQAVVIGGGLTEPSTFQKAAEAQGYRPKYPIANTFGIEFTDAVADIAYDANAQEGNLGLGISDWRWAQRKPATPKDNPKMAYCLKAYQDFTKKTLDVFDNDAEIRNAIHSCSAFEAVREALVRAGPNLTDQTYLAALNSLQNFPTSEFVSLSFNGKRHGSDVFATAQFQKARWQPSNNYWDLRSPWARFYVP